MAQFLIVVPPLTGHINPLLSVAAELVRKGHTVAWAGHTDILKQHLEEDVTCYSLPVIDSSYVDQNWYKVRGLDSVKFFYEHFYMPMAEACLLPLEEAVNDCQPDMIICDHQMIAGALVARKLGLRWVSSMTTSASILRLWDVLEDWLAQQMAELQRSYGVEKIIKRPDFSPYGCIVFSSPALVGEDQPCFDAPYHYVGPAIDHSRKSIDFPWHKLDDSKQKILISLGTVSRDRSLRFYQIMIAALRNSDLQVIMVAPEELECTIPDNFIVRSRVPQLELLPLVDLVVSHAGHNTVCETLNCGKPMVVAPIRDDQPVIARQVVSTGAGRSIRFGKVSENAARDTIFTVLGDVSYRQNAERIQQSFAPLEGSSQAVTVMEALLSAPQTTDQDCDQGSDHANA